MPSNNISLFGLNGKNPDSINYENELKNLKIIDYLGKGGQGEVFRAYF